MIGSRVLRPAPLRGVHRSLAGDTRRGASRPGRPTRTPNIGGVDAMIRSFRWPLMAACLVGGVAVGRYVGPTAAHGELSPAGKAIPAEWTSYRDVVKPVLPAVVSIESKMKAKKADRPSTRGRQFQPDDQDAPDLRRFFEEFQRRQQEESPREQALGFGSGFIVDAAGVI